jgi:hypothetical protein
MRTNLHTSAQDTRVGSPERAALNRAIDPPAGGVGVRARTFDGGLIGGVAGRHLDAGVVEGHVQAAER